MRDEKETRNSVISLLPGYNCGACGYARCDAFAGALSCGEVSAERCRPLKQERYAEQRASVMAILEGPPPEGREKPPRGILEGYEADFILKPLPAERACREMIHFFCPVTLRRGDVVRYRPLGCPISHTAEVVDTDYGLTTVRVIGPLNRLGKELNIIDAGIGMILGFQGIVSGPVPGIGKTVRFVPNECMMQKVHSGVVVACEGRRITIECIDLKVWAPPIGA